MPIAFLVLIPSKVPHRLGTGMLRGLPQRTPLQKARFAPGLLSF